MFKKSLYITVFAGIFISSCADAPKENYFPHHNSDLVVETAIEYGRLPNGLRYAVMSNETKVWHTFWNTWRLMDRKIYPKVR